MFENDDPKQRKQLIKALKKNGLDAWELNSGGGTMHVIVTLFDFSVNPLVNSATDATLFSKLESTSKEWTSDGYLYIATNSLQSDCEIGLMGWDGRTDAQVSLEAWKPIESLEEAVQTIQQHWNDRDKYIQAYLAGELVAW